MKLLKRLKRIGKGLAARKPAPKKASTKAPAAKKRPKRAAPPRRAARPKRVARPARPTKRRAPPKAARPKRIERKRVIAPRGALKKAKRAAKKGPAKVAKEPKQHVPKRVSEFAQTLMQQETAEKKELRQYPVLPGGQNQRLAMLLPLLRELVKRQVIADWLINAHHARSANMYVERNFTVEDELVSLREDVLVTIYQRFPDGTMGEAQIPIITTDPAAAKQQIMEAKETCSYARKKAFRLPEPVDDLTLPQSYDERLLQAAFSGSGIQVCREIFERIKAIMVPVADVRMNALEVLTSAGTVRVINSNGIDVSYHKTAIYLEAVLTCKAANEEREFTFSRTAVSPEQLDLQALLLQQAQIARDATAAKPNPGFSGDVLLGPQSITEVFAPRDNVNPLILHTSAKVETMGLSSLKINQPIGQFIGEPITLTTNPSLPLGLATAPVDEEGTPLRPVELIRNGTFVNYLATTRYAQYLNVPVTGNLSNIQIGAGATREQHLRGNNYFEIVSFSWFNPDVFSGEFSAEIRLGYHWLNGRKTPLRGGTLVGNLFKSILNTRFSKEVMQAGQYYGPRAILFKNSQIAKME